MWINVYVLDDHYVGSWKVNPDDLVEEIKDKIEKDYQINRHHYNLVIEDLITGKEIRMYDGRPLSDYFYNDNQIVMISPKPIWKIILVEFQKLLKKGHNYQKL